MGYDKHQVAREFTSWSESYDRSILQWLLFGPSHRVLDQTDPRSGRGTADQDAGRRLRHGLVCIQGQGMLTAG